MEDFFHYVCIIGCSLAMGTMIAKAEPLPPLPTPKPWHSECTVITIKALDKPATHEAVCYDE